MLDAATADVIQKLIEEAPGTRRPRSCGGGAWAPRAAGGGPQRIG